MAAAKATCCCVDGGRRMSPPPGLKPVADDDALVIRAKGGPSKSLCGGARAIPCTVEAVWSLPTVSALCIFEAVGGVWTAAGFMSLATLNGSPVGILPGALFTGRGEGRDPAGEPGGERDLPGESALLLGSLGEPVV